MSRLSRSGLNLVSDVAFRMVFLSVFIVFMFGMTNLWADVNLVSPENASATNAYNDTIQFIYNQTGTLSGTVSCTLFIDGVESGSNISVNANETTTQYANHSLNESLHLWNVRCTNGTNNEFSVNNTLIIDRLGFIITFIGAAEPDQFVSSNPANNQLTLIVNASDIGLAGIDYLTANFTALEQPGINYVNMTYNDTTGLWNASIIVTDVSNFAFSPLNVSVFGSDKAGNGFSSGQDWTYFILYNFSQPPMPACYQWGPETTDLQEETDFGHVNYVLELQTDINCSVFHGNISAEYPEYPAWMSTYETVAIFNFTSLNMSDPTIGSKLGMLFNNTKVDIKLPGQFGDSRIYFNTSYLHEFNTSATVSLFHLPFTSKPEINPDEGAAGVNGSASIVWTPGFGEGNLTFSVLGFSGYNITDNATPIITLISPLNASNTSDATPLINFTVNGTGSKPSYILVQLDNASYVYNYTSSTNQTNCEYIDASLELMMCGFSPSTNLSDGSHTLYILARDFGGATGNAANSTTSFTVDTTAPVVNITTPSANSLSDLSITIGVSATELTMNYTNISIYNSTGDLINSTVVPANTTMQVVLNVLESGSYNITATSFDMMGLNGSSTVANVTVDATSPVVAISSPTSDSESNTTTITVVGNSTDGHLNYTIISIYNSTGDLVNSTTTTNASWTVRFLVPNNVSYNITAVAYDLVGNNGSDLVSNLTVNDTLAPSVTAISSSTSGSTVTLSVTTDEYATCRYSTSNIAFENMTNMTTTGGLTHSIGISYSSSSSGTYYVRCADANGNTMNVSNSTTYSVTISSSSSSSSTTTTTNVTQPVLPQPPLIQPSPQPTEQPSQPTAAPGTSSTIEITNEIAKFVASPVAGQPLVIDVLKQAPAIASISGISKISVSTSTSSSNVQVSVKPLFAKPAEVSEPAKKVLKYIQINVDMPSIQSAKLTFVVTKADLKKMNLDASTIKLLRYANGAWQELSTELGFEDLNSYTFEATTPGFSYFAIAGEEIKAPAETPKVTTNVTEEEPSVTVEQPAKKEESPLGLIILILIIAAVAYLYFTGKKR